jgi:porin
MRTRFSALLIFGALTLGSAAAQDASSNQDRLTGDWGGMRAQLQDAGIDLGLAATLETLSNPNGGIRQTTVYQGLVTPSLNLELEKLANWPRGNFYIDAYQISGRGLSRNAIGNLLAVSSIEALASTRLHDLWLEQGLPDGRSSLRIGQIALDDNGEFYRSPYSAKFVNSTFGCPDLLAADLPSGGPCYPFATPGARLRAAPNARLSLSAAAFNGNPAPPGPGDPQVRNASGTNFLIGVGGFLAIAELGYAFDQESASSPRPSNIKLGGWYHTADFPDLRRDTLGRSLADPTSSGIAALHGGNFGLYLIADRTLWPSADTAAKGLAAFLRVGGAPPDRNLISLEVDAGLNYQGPFLCHEADVLGIAVSYARIGDARLLDRDQIRFTGIERPIRDYEAVLEMSYQAATAPGWILQPDLQLIFHPGGGVAAPAGRPIPNALVVGLRSLITF